MASPSVATTYRETFDQGAGGWIGWDEKGAAPLEARDGAVISRSPWWVDYNHAPPGGGYLHILFALYTARHGKVPEINRTLGGTNRFIGGGYSTDLTNTRFTFRIKGELNSRGARLVLLVQGDISPDPAKPFWINQVLTGQTIGLTPQWSEQTIQLVPDQKQWTNLGSRHDRRDWYGQAPIADLLRNVNGDIIVVLFPLDVRPLRPLRGDSDTPRAGLDYEVDRSRLPEGWVMLDDVTIDFPPGPVTP